MNEQIIQAINKSEYFKRINASAKAVYESAGREPSAEEYQALRNVLICQTMLEDETVRAIVAKSVYAELNKEE